MNIKVYLNSTQIIKYRILKYRGVVHYILVANVPRRNVTIYI